MTTARPSERQFEIARAYTLPNLSAMDCGEPINPEEVYQALRAVLAWQAEEIERVGKNWQAEDVNTLMTYLTDDTAKKIAAQQAVILTKVMAERDAAIAKLREAPEPAMYPESHVHDTAFDPVYASWFATLSPWRGK